MAEGDDDQDDAERDQCFTSPQAEDEQSTGDKLYEWNRNADEPKRPERQESIRKRKEILSRMFHRPKLKDFPNSGHEEDQTQDEPREQHRPAALTGKAHSSTSVFAEEGEEGVGDGLGILFRTFWNCGLFSCHL